MRGRAESRKEGSPEEKEKNEEKEKTLKGEKRGAESRDMREKRGALRNMSTGVRGVSRLN